MVPDGGGLGLPKGIWARSGIEEAGGWERMVGAGHLSERLDLVRGADEDATAARGRRREVAEAAAEIEGELEGTRRRVEAVEDAVIDLVRPDDAAGDDGRTVSGRRVVPGLRERGAAQLERMQ